MTGNTQLVRRSVIACSSISFVLLMNTSCMLGKDFERALTITFAELVEHDVVVPWYMGGQGACATYDLWLTDSQWSQGTSPRPPRQRTYTQILSESDCGDDSWRLAAIEVLYPDRGFTEWCDPIILLNDDQKSRSLHEVKPERMIHLSQAESMPERPKLTVSPPDAAKSGYDQQRYDIYWKHIGESPARYYVSRVQVGWPTIAPKYDFPHIIEVRNVTAFEPQAVSDAHWERLNRRAGTQSSTD